MSENRYILITGTGFVNKGSQAMLFNAVDELKKRFPDKEIIDLSTLDYDKGDVNQYNFKIMQTTFRFLFLKDMQSLEILGSAYYVIKGKIFRIMRWKNGRKKWPKYMRIHILL